MYKKNIKELLITVYKVFTYAILLFTFIFTMKNVNYALWAKTRTAGVTASAFLLSLTMMQHIYGNFEIGFKKSKPVFISTMISVLFADFIAVLAMLIMGSIQFPVQKVIVPAFFYGILTYSLQGMVVWISAHLGNDLYFTLFNPETVLIFNKDNLIFEKVFKFIKNHDKQYKIINIETVFKTSMIDKNIDSIFAFGLDPVEEQELIEYCYKNEIKLTYNASQHNFLTAKQNTIVIDDALLIEIVPFTPTLIQLFLKRLIDIVGSLILLVISIPFYIVIAIFIKIEDGGPIIFKQERVTKDNKIFEIYKFRSMIVDAGINSAKLDDDRITKVGHIIRKLRVDELPQAINILKGEISLVGPRPESLTNVELYTSELKDFTLRHKVKAGLTGYAQIFGKYNTTPEMKLLLDLKYIENFSITEDIKLLFQTVIVFIKPDSTEGF